MDYNVGYLIVSFINSLIIMFGMSNILLFPIRRENKLFITVYLFLIYLFAAPYLGQYATILLVVGTLIIIASCNRYYFLNTIFSLMGYFLYIVINHIMLFFADLFGISTSALYQYNFISVIFMSIYAIFVYFSTYFIGKYLRKKLIKIADLPQIVQALFFFEMLCGAGIIVANIVLAEKNNYPSKIINFNLILFGILMTVTIIILFMIIYYVQKNEEIHLRQKEKLSLEEYTLKSEQFYQYASNTKKKFNNIFSLAQHYVEEDSFEDLKCLFNKTDSSDDTELINEDCLDMLNEIKILELKSIVYSKLLDAKNKNLQIDFHVKNEITDTSMDILDLTKIVEEFLSNAIYAACESEEKHLEILLVTDDISSMILVSNSSLELECNLEEVYNEGVTSKYKHEGLGLYRVNQILGKYRNIIHSTDYKDCVFTQKLEICNTIS